MTQKEKNPFFDDSTQSDIFKPESAQNSDFSFFDEPSETAPKSTNESASNDFSFFDEPAVTTPKNENQSSDFSFFDDLVTSEKNEPKKDSSELDLHFNDDLFSSAVPEKAEQKKVSLEKTDEEPVVTDDVSTASTVETRLMKFTCRKCATVAEIAFDAGLSAITDTSCTSCAIKIHITLEPPSKRATQKSREIYCSKCGSLLVHHPHCPSCGCFCPDYYVVENPDEAARRARSQRSNSIKQAIADIGSVFSKKPAEPASLSSLSIGKKAGNLKKGKLSFLSMEKPLIPVLSIIGLVIVAGVSVFFYVTLKQEQKYVGNYVKAVYIIHTGSQLATSSLNKKAAEWKTALESGRSFLPQTDSEAEVKISRTTTEINKLLPQIQKPPKKYQQAHTRLMSFHGEYNKLLAISNEKPASLEQLKKQIESSDKAIKQTVQELKNNLNGALPEEMNNAKKKYRGLSAF